MFLVGGDGRSPSSPGMHDGLPPLSARSWRISSSSVMDDLRMFVVVVVVCVFIHIPFGRRMMNHRNAATSKAEESTKKGRRLVLADHIYCYL